MGDLGNEIFRKYGLTAVVVALVVAVVLAVTIWGVTHLAASPGTEVSVLWGLVRYTKAPQEVGTRPTVTKPLQEIETRPSGANGQFAPRTGADNLQQISIEIVGNVSGSDAPRTIDSLRRSHGLRELTPLESGKPIAELPIGCYFYISVEYIGSRSFADRPKDFLLSTPATRVVDQGYMSLYCEAHLLANSGLTLVGFASEQNAADVSHLSGAETHSIVFSPYVLPSMHSLISLPVDRIMTYRLRRIQMGKGEEFRVFDMTVK